jgi:hypothetical protein
MKGKKMMTSMRGGFLSMSKPVMVIVIVACLVIAIVAYVAMLPDRGGGYEDLAGQMQWVKCTNPDCNAEYEMDKAEFLSAVGEKKKINPLLSYDPPIACKECGQETVVEAVKCEQCGKVFVLAPRGTGGFRDECPDCGHSAMREQRKKSASK